MTDMAVLLLFGGGALLAALGALLTKGRSAIALLAAVCTAGGVLSALALGWTLDRLQTPVFIVCAAAMAAALPGKGDGEA